MGVGTYASAVHVGTIPTDVPNLFYWVDAADPSTIDLSGSFVTEWRDRSANGYEFFGPVVPDDCPTYVTGAINGLNAMTWNGVARFSSREPDLPGHVSRTYCWIMNPTDTTVVITIMSIGGVMVLKITADGQFHIANGNVVLFPVDCFGLHVWTAEFNGATSKVFKDGLQVWTGDAGTAGAPTFRNNLCCDSFGGLPFLGYMPEMAVYSGTISTTNREGLETYLYSKWAGGVPGAPRLDTATISVPAPTTVTLGWTQGVNSSLVTDYTIEKSPDGTSSWTTVTDTVSTATSYTVSGLTTGVIQYFRVKAVNEVGTGAASNVKSATPGVETHLDEFNRANGNLGANWFQDGNDFQIVSNQVRMVNNYNDKSAKWGTDIGSSNMEASAYITHTGNGGKSGPLVRTNSNQYDKSGYFTVIIGSTWDGVPSGRVGVSLMRSDGGGSNTTIAGPTTVGTDNTEAMKLTIRCVGSTITSLVNDVVVHTVTDTTITTGTYAGFRLLTDSLYQATIDWFNAVAI